MVTLGDYLIVSGILFAIGFAGVMLRRNLIVILMSLELMLNAANLSLVAFSRFRLQPSGLPDYNAQIFVFFIITVAAAEVRSEERRVGKECSARWSPSCTKENRHTYIA